MDNNLTIVGIGASAGGLDALKTFFKNIPNDTGFAYVVVVHLSPEHKSFLSEILQQFTVLPVQQVTETIPLKPNQIYVIPPGANLNTIDTHLRLSELDEKRRNRAPIDHFFRTLSNTHDGNAIGIILTGTGSDGSLGIKEIKSRNGIVIVQDPKEAEFDGMPQNAIVTGMVDLVLPLQEIAARIVELGKHIPKVSMEKKKLDLDTKEQELLQKIFTQIKVRNGKDFSEYKISTIMRRLRRRMNLFHITELSAYLEFLRESPKEVNALSDDFLVTVTSFFRDPEVYQKIENDIIPQILNKKNTDDIIRIWSVGCSSGEEAYSLIILLLEAIEKIPGSPSLKVFASDLHDHSLNLAREGFYPGDITIDINQERLNKYFIKEDGGFRIKKEIREQVIFTPHNLLSDPPFSKIDLIVCRNLLIYLKKEVQKDVFNLFHYALQPGGHLVLGSSETLDNSELFRVDSKKSAIYIKRNVAVPDLRLPVFPMGKNIVEPLSKDEKNLELPTNGLGSLHQRIAERYGPPSVLITPENQILHLSEHAGRFMNLPGGEFTNNIFKLIREELRIELRSTIQEARENKGLVRSKTVWMKINEELKQIRLYVNLVNEPKQENFNLVMFEEISTSEEYPSSQIKTDNVNEGSNFKELETELEVNQKRLESIIEEYETSQEEMKASNEELQSANEELRSTLEELETSKEELQSINEELATVNQENKLKVEELIQLSSDLQNFLAATNIATLFLNKSFNILRYTPQVTEIFNIRPADRGRLITDLTHRLNYSELIADAEQVIKKLITIEREIKDNAGKWYLVRLLPYRTTEDRIEGVVITFIDITSRKNYEEKLLESEEHLKLIFEGASEYAIFTLGKDKKINSWNSGAEKILGYQKDEIIGKSGDLVFIPKDRDYEAPKELKTALEKGQATNERWHLRKDGGRFWGSGMMMSLTDKEGKNRGFLKILRDQTTVMEARKNLKTSERELRELTSRYRFSLEAGKIGIWEWNFTTDEVNWSPRKQEFYGIDPIINKSIKKATKFFASFIHPDDYHLVMKALELAKNQEHSKFDLEFRIKKPDGSIVWVAERGENQFEDGKAVKMFGTSIDITERKNLEQQKDDFIGIASHELKTPVAVMKGYVAMIEKLLRKKGSLQEADLLSKVNQQIVRITTLINDLLDVTKIESGTIKFDQQVFDFDRMVAEIIDSMQHISDHKLIQKGSTGQKVFGDKDRIGQVIINLISNAVKYSPEADTVIIESGVQDSVIKLVVKDFGIGISEKNIDKIFNRFYRIREESGNKSSGLGLGLYISAEIIKRHAGSMLVESKEGEGSVFGFTLPVIE